MTAVSLKDTTAVGPNQRSSLPLIHSISSSKNGSFTSIQRRPVLTAATAAPTRESQTRSLADGEGRSSREGSPASGISGVSRAHAKPKGKKGVEKGKAAGKKTTSERSASAARGRKNASRGGSVTPASAGKSLSRSSSAGSKSVKGKRSASGSSVRGKGRALKSGKGAKAGGKKTRKKSAGRSVKPSAPSGDDDLSKSFRTGLSSILRCGLGGGDSRMPSILAIEEQRAREELLLEEHITFESGLMLYHRQGLATIQKQARCASRPDRRSDDELVLARDELRLVASEVADRSMNTLLDRLQMQERKDLEQLHAENSSLKEILSTKSALLERGGLTNRDLEDRLARLTARSAAHSESIKAEVTATLRKARFDVDSMKKELGNRIDVATASLLTPKYDTALQELRTATASVQRTIQEHSDTLHFLIESIGAKNAFLKDRSETMHSNYPVAFRDELRMMSKEQLLNLLDVVSFQDGVVETVGRALFVLKKNTSYAENVF